MPKALALKGPAETQVKSVENAATTKPAATPSESGDMLLNTSLAVGAEPSGRATEMAGRPASRPPALGDGAPGPPAWPRGRRGLSRAATALPACPGSTRPWRRRRAAG